MNCSEFKEQVGAWALDALSRDEAAAMRAHLEQAEPHDGCEEALARARSAAAALASSLLPVAPADDVWNRIEARLTPRAATPRRALHFREAAAWAIAASFAASVLVLHHDRRAERDRADQATALLAETKKGLDARDECLKELEMMKQGSSLKRDAVALLEKPTTKVVPLAPLEGKPYHASAIVNLAERRVIVLASSMPQVAGKDFELWVIRGTAAPSAAGFMHAAGGGIEVGEIDPALLGDSEPDAFAVSLEPLGGRPTPTEVLMVGALHG